MKPFIKYIFFTVLFFVPLALWAAEPVGQVVFVRGDVKVLHVDNPAAKDLIFNDPIYPMDTLETKQGELRVLLTDETVLSLGENSKLLVTQYVYHPKNLERTSIFDILKGKVRTIIQKTKTAFREDQVTLKTPTAVAGIRGTDVGITVNGKNTQFICFDGAFDASFKGDPASKVLVQTGMFTQINNAAPTPPADIPPQLMQSFSNQLNPAPLNQVLDQKGGDNLQAPGGEESRVEGMDNPPPPPPPEEQLFESGTNPDGNDPLAPPPMPPAFIPGGGTETPPDAATGSSSTAPVEIPVSFPSGASDPAGSSGGASGTQTGPINIPISFPGGVQT